VRYFTTVQEPFTRNREHPGDIDLIIFSEVNKAIAFECKIVKATSQPTEKAKINKAEKLKEGVRQVNDYLKFGFSQVYLLIIILNDGRYYNKPNFINNHTLDGDLSKIYNGNWKNDLDNRIGIIYCKIEQTRNLSVDFNNNILFKIERSALSKKQNVKTKKMIESISDY